MVRPDFCSCRPGRHQNTRINLADIGQVLKETTERFLPVPDVACTGQGDTSFSYI